MTIGDVFAVIASVIAICVSAWGLFMGMALLFQRRSQQACRIVQVAPWRSLLFGLGLLFTVGLMSAVLLYVPNPIVKFMGWSGIMALLAIASLGASGIAQMIAGRIQKIESGISGFSALSKGSAILVISGLVPLFGWFVFAPLTLLVSMGVGVQALLTKVSDESTITSPPVNLEAL